MEKITATQAREYLDRWKEVHQAQQTLDRATSVDTRLRQLSAMMCSRELFAKDPHREEEVKQLRDHWLRVRAAFSG